MFAHANAQGTDIPEIGEVKEGYLADLIMIEGDPLTDVTLFQDKGNICMIMKDGKYHKPFSSSRQAAERQGAVGAD